MSGVRRAVESAVGLVLRSRYGVAALIAIVVIGVLGSARLVAGPSGAEPDPPAARHRLHGVLDRVNDGADERDRCLGQDGLGWRREP